MVKLTDTQLQELVREEAIRRGLCWNAFERRWENLYNPLLQELNIRDQVYNLPNPDNKVE